MTNLIQTQEISPVLQLIERVALDPSADVAKLEKMIELQERVMKTQAKSQFDQAMLQFQIKKPILEKASQGHNSKYAKLEYIQSQIEPVLREFGLFVRWSTEATQDNKTRVTCICTHIGGHSETSSMDVVPDKGGSKSDIQANGSAISYAQRYTLRSLLGLVIANDNDGQTRATITPQQAKILEKKLSYLGNDVKEKMLAHIGCELHEIEKGAFEYWCNQLDSRVAKKEDK